MAICYAVGFSDELNNRKASIIHNGCVELVLSEQEAIDKCKGNVISYVRVITDDVKRALIINMISRALHECRILNREHSYYSVEFAYIRSREQGLFVLNK